MDNDCSSKHWFNKDEKEFTSDFIDHIYDRYYKNYLKESVRYEKMNNILFAIVAAIGFTVTTLIGLQEILRNYLSDHAVIFFTCTAFLLPSVSSLIVLFISQKGLKKKEELREEARIKSKYLINASKIRYITARETTEYVELYNWLNDEIQNLQLRQAQGYFSAHNKFEKTSGGEYN